ncbi:hypothetical protein INT45_006839, partial [Circinella minor]
MSMRHQNNNSSATATVDNEDDEDEIDETILYQDARKKSVYYRPNQTVQQVIECAEQKLSTPEAYFELNRYVEVFTWRRPGFLGWNCRFNVTFGADAELGTKPASDATILSDP